ncbi:MAG TPA: undecaprenyl-diphosphate phosphatase [Baekduia sp.]|nr:undecaprenyl-diphosphate phosphatase [Baekduia sp.]
MPPDGVAQPTLTAGRAALLGLLHGPAELLPVSSSAHIALVPGLLGWPPVAPDPATRKSFEVALHAGTLVGAGRALGRPRLWYAALTLAPAAVAALALEDQIERRLGTPVTTAAGLVAGSVLMVAADRRPGRRPAASAGPGDALAIGAAQALALVPGLSRSGMTYAAARRRGFGPDAAAALSREAAAGVLAAATALKTLRLVQDGLAPPLRAPFAAGAAASALAARLCSPLARRRPPVRAAAVHRLLLAAAAVGSARRP